MKEANRSHMHQSYPFAEKAASPITTLPPSGGPMAASNSEIQASDPRLPAAANRRTPTQKPGPEKGGGEWGEAIRRAGPGGRGRSR